MIEEFHYMEEVNNIESVKTPAAEYFFTVNHNATNLNAEKSYVFHATIAKALFLYKGSRPDIQITVPFLCTRFKGPDEDNCKNLLKMIKSIQDKQDGDLTFNINDMTMAYW